MLLLLLLHPPPPPPRSRPSWPKRSLPCSYILVLGMSRLGELQQTIMTLRSFGCHKRSMGGCCCCCCCCLLCLPTAVLAGQIGASLPLCPKAFRTSTGQVGGPRHGGLTDGRICPKRKVDWEGTAAPDGTAPPDSSQGGGPLQLTTLSDSDPTLHPDITVRILPHGATPIVRTLKPAAPR